MRYGLVSELLRAVSRFAIVGVVGGLAAGCSSDAVRLSSNPFSNPFGSDHNEGPRTTGSIDGGSVAPLPRSSVESAPLAAPNLSPAPRQTASASSFNRPQAYRPAAVAARSGGPVGWSVEGGTPITVADGDSLSAISTRYGVPTTAILSANGLSASEVRPGRRVVIPVYGASAARDPSHVASALPARSEERPVTHAKVADEMPRRDTLRQEPPRREASRHETLHEAPAREAERHARKDESDRPTHLARAETKEHAEAKGHARSEREAREEEHRKAESKVAAAKAEKAQKLARLEHGKDAKVELSSSRKETASHHEKVAKAEATRTESVKTAEVPKPDKQPRKVASLAPVKAVPEPEVVKTSPAREKEPESTGALPAAPSAEFRWPAHGRVITGFGGSSSNEGINISVPDGTPVKATESGVVAYAGSEVKGYGNLVLIRHDNGFVSAYAHNGELDVKRGQRVTRGQTIAKSGQSGNVTSPQLHFEIRKGSTPVDPMRFLASN